jgi:predicted metal-dependent hydrolase
LPLLQGKIEEAKLYCRYTQVMMLTIPEKLSINNCDYNIAIEFKKKKNSSARVNGDTIILRISNRLSKVKQQEHITYLIESIKKKLLKKGFTTRSHFLNIDENFVIANKNYTAEIIYQERKSCRVDLDEDNNFTFYIPTDLEYSEAREIVKKGLLKALGARNKDFITDLLHYINNKYFKYKIKEVRFKTLKSKWGECNSQHVITLNTSLLFCPLEITEYIIIHELAHIDMYNHSEKYWKKVENVLPEYREREAWLRKHGHNILHMKLQFRRNPDARKKKP